MIDNRRAQLPQRHPPQPDFFRRAGHIDISSVAGLQPSKPLLLVYQNLTAMPDNSAGFGKTVCFLIENVVSNAAFSEREMTGAKLFYREIAWDAHNSPL